MDNSIQKKKTSITHRRIKTDFNINSNNNALASGYATPISLRHKTQVSQHRTSSYFKSGGQLTRRPNYRHTRNYNTQQYKYNKWYIKPNIRLKKSLIPEIKPKQLDIDYEYNKLYQENILRIDCPFLVNKNDKLKLLDKIPVHNLKLLENFKKNQEGKKKRVPKIVELFLNKRNNNQLI